MRRVIYSLTLCVLLFTSGLVVFGEEVQDISEIEVTLSYENVKLNDVLRKLSKDYGLNILFPDQEVKDIVVSFSCQDMPVLSAIAGMLENTTVEAALIGENQIVIRKRKGQKLVRLKGNLFGKVIDKKTKEPLPFVNVSLVNTTKGALTDNYGFFRIPGIIYDDYIIRFSYMGYNTFFDSVTINQSSQMFNVSMAEQDLRGEEVIVIGERMKKEEGLGVISLSSRLVKALPSMAESDVMRSLQYLPGVFSYSDFSADFHVRGGKTDENMIMLDGITIYNPFHLGGILSTFDENAMRVIDLLRGQVMPEYGGRLSSILSLTSRDGKMDRIQGNVMASLLTSKGLIEGPVGESFSFMLSYRRTYFDQIFSFFPYHFYDGIGKITYRINNNNEIRLNTFAGSDIVDPIWDENSNFSDFDFRLNWRNRTYGVNWRYVQSASTFWETSFSISRFILDIYNYTGNDNLINTDDEINFKVLDKVDDIAFQTKMSTYWKDVFFIKTGMEYHNIGLKFYVDSDSKIYSDYDKSSNELIYFAQMRYNYSINAMLEGGLRFSYFDFNRNINVEPRIGFAYSITNKLKFRSSVGYFTQNIASLNVGIGSVKLMNVWEFIEKPMKSQKCLQTSAGLDYSLENTRLSFELYHKKYFRVLFRNTFPTSDFFGPIRDEKGEAYGGELFLTRESKRYFMLLSYAFGWTVRVNDYGASYYPPFDRRQAAKFNMGYNFSRSGKISLSGLFQSGSLVPVKFGEYRKRYMEHKTKDQDIIFESVKFRKNSYKRIDLNLYWEWKHWEFYFQILNVFNFNNNVLKNVSESYGVDIDGEITMPIFPTFGLGLKF